MHPRLQSLLAGGALLLLPLAPIRAESPWSLHVRATWAATADKSDAFSALGINFGANAISTNDKLIPEFDVDYAFTPSLAAEVVLSTPQKFDVSLAGVGKLGSFTCLPPTFLLQYHPSLGGGFEPYVGAGVNYTLIWNTNLSVASVPLGLDNDSFGLAGQAGFDWSIDANWSFNFDYKYIGIRSKVYAGSAALTTARLNPSLYSIGFRYKF